MILSCRVPQEVPAGTKDSPGGPWEFVGLLPLFDPPRHDSAETIRRALDLGVSVKMITGLHHDLFIFLLAEFVIQFTFIKPTLFNKSFLVSSYNHYMFSEINYCLTRKCR